MSGERTVQGSRILICRLSHIGDCVLTLPLLHQLRAARPDSWIAWAVERPTPQLLENHPDLDEVITIPKGWLKSPKSILAVRRQLRSLRFDIAVDPQSIAKSSLLARVSGARQRLGFNGKHGRELSNWFNNLTVQPNSDHLVDRSLELLNALDIQPQPAEFNLPIDPDAESGIEQFLTERGLADSHYVVINPGASWPSKRWETDRYGSVAEQIHKRSDLVSIVTWAGESELEMAMSICADSNGTAILAPRTNLQQLAALLKRSILFLGCDTGPLHLAAAVGTTCVGMYGPTRPQDSGAYGQQHHAIQNEFQSGSNRERRNGTNRSMKSISTAQVVDACCRAIATTRLTTSRTVVESSPSRDQAA